MIELTLAQIEANASYAPTNMLNYDPRVSPLLQFLYLYGLRINECYQISRWSVYSPTEFKVITEKGSAPRYVLIADTPTEISDNIGTTNEIYPYMRYSTLRRYLQYCIKPNVYHDSGYRISTHLFRYNRAKQMYNAGIPIAQIMTFFGELDQGNMMSYITEKLYRL